MHYLLFKVQSKHKKAEKYSVKNLIYFNTEFATFLLFFMVQIDIFAWNVFILYILLVRGGKKSHLKKLRIYIFYLKFINKYFELITLKY